MTLTMHVHPPVLEDWMLTAPWVETVTGRCAECGERAARGAGVYLHVDVRLCSFCLPIGIPVI